MICGNALPLHHVWMLKNNMFSTSVLYTIAAINICRVRAYLTIDPRTAPSIRELYKTDDSVEHFLRGRRKGKGTQKPACPRESIERNSCGIQQATMLKYSTSLTSLPLTVAFSPACSATVREEAVAQNWISDNLYIFRATSRVFKCSHQRR